MNKDDQKLKDSFTILSVFHYIVGALSFLMSFIPIVYLIIGFVLVVAPGGMESGNREEEAMVGWVFLVVSTLIILVGLTVAVCTVLTGYYLTRRKKYNFCFAVSILECLFFPFGTALGIVTLIMLNKDESKQLFGKTVQKHKVA